MADANYFKQSFKYFKQKPHSETLNSVLNIDDDTSKCATLLDNFAHENVIDPCATCLGLGLGSYQGWHVYKFTGLNGFYYIRNPFVAGSQFFWVRKCLEQYPRKPSITNLDLHHPYLDDVWSSAFVDKLSWATFGYHYDWDKKLYCRTHFSIFPKCLSDLTRHIASHLGFQTFDPDAAIVNYYNTKSTLGIHNDHSEEELGEPIVSLSFGLSAVFLVGIERVDERPPLPLLLKSGDVVILSGDSRLAYHAVPAIIQENSVEWDCSGFADYIKCHRINISARQVYAKRHDSHPPEFCFHCSEGI